MSQTSTLSATDSPLLLHTINYIIFSLLSEAFRDLNLEEPCAQRFWILKVAWYFGGSSSLYYQKMDAFSTLYSPFRYQGPLHLIVLGAPFEADFKQDP